jgi:hypothetical protein
VKNPILPWSLLLSILFACASPRPQISLPEVPAAPLVRALDQRRESFESLKAVARVEVERRGRRRAYESVAFVQKGQDRLRVEGFGMLGEPIFAAVWDGQDVLLRSASDPVVHRTGPAGFERLLGMPLAPSDLCATLSGNIPPMPPGADTRAGCGTDGRCTVEFRYDDTRWFITLIMPSSDSAGTVVLESAELYRDDGLVFRSRFEASEMVGDYRLAKRVFVESPGRMVTVLVQYLDVAVNVPVQDGAFVLDDEDAR